ncbi:YceI family protein [Chitinimonas sp. BJYL2]|uniref:YceI family protein n=1 Tax=Chitinimonas sp. BJYL2 TaxID=2976696 RepID=UPI0022B53B14|nr:YceI family protein [Chitinimonas sp. BJYL2]
MNTVMKRIALTSLLLTAGLSHAAPVDTAKSSVRFNFSQMNVPVEGQFKKFASDITFDAAKPESGKVSISVDLMGADAGSSDANQALHMKEWFDTARFPKATFTSTQIKALGGGRFQATGQFGLKGRTAALSVPFTVRSDAAGQWFEGVFPLSRLAWKVGEGEWADVGAVADLVQVKFKLFVPK